MHEGRIRELTGQLLACGYSLEQVNYIIREALEGHTGDTDEQAQLVIETLEGYLLFGSRCKLGKSNDSATG